MAEIKKGGPGSGIRGHKTAKPEKAEKPSMKSQPMSGVDHGTGEKSLAQMSHKELKSEFDKVKTDQSKVAAQLMEAGHGDATMHEIFTEKHSGPLFDKFVANETRMGAIRQEGEGRYGKGFLSSSVKKGGPGSGVSENNTRKIGMPHSPFTSVGTRKGMLENMAHEEKSIPMDKITHVGQEKYVPKKLKTMVKNFEEVKEKPIDVLQVGHEFHVIDGHHRYLAAKHHGEKEIRARVRVKAEVSKGGEGSGVKGHKTAADHAKNVSDKAAAKEKARAEWKASEKSAKAAVNAADRAKDRNDPKPKSLDRANAKIAEHNKKAEAYNKAADEHVAALKESLAFHQSKVGKMDPGSSSVHVNAPLGSEEDKIHKADETEMGSNADAMLDMQDVVDGMDWEMALNPALTTDGARVLSMANLHDNADFYRTMRLEAEKDDSLRIAEKALGITKEIDPNRALKLDLGSGQCRAPGHLGLDLYPYDHGTIVHDLSLGIPFADGSASHVRMTNSLHHMDGVSTDALTSEVARVLQPGGEFHYEGPEKLEAPEGLVQKDATFLEPTEENGGWSQQTFEAKPDAATANDAEPMRDPSENPLDVMLATEVLGDYWPSAAPVHKSSDEKWITMNGTPVLIKGGKHQNGPMKGKEHKPGKGSKHEGKGAKGHGGKHPDSNSGGHGSGGHNGKPGGHGAGGHGNKGGHKHEGGGEHFNPLEALNEATEESVHQMSPRVRVGKSASVPIFKINKYKQIVYGVVLAPDEADLQSDFMTAEDIEEAAHEYLSQSRVVGQMHEGPIDAAVVESYIAPADFDSEGQHGPQKVKKGSWIIGVKVNDPKEWAKVLEGEYNGFSVGGMGVRDPV